MIPAEYYNLLNQNPPPNIKIFFQGFDLRRTFCGNVHQGICAIQTICKSLINNEALKIFPIFTHIKFSKETLL